MSEDLETLRRQLNELADERHRDAELLGKSRLFQEMNKQRQEVIVEVFHLRAECERLRGLIKKAEWAGDDGIPLCPWCHSDEGSEDNRIHAADCPAFNQDGTVK